MNFIIALHWNSNQTHVDSFRCVGLNRHKDLTEPVDISRAELLARLQEGEVFHLLRQTNCRWDVGARLEAIEKRGQWFIKAMASNLERPRDEMPELPRF